MTRVASLMSALSMDGVDNQLYLDLDNSERSEWLYHKGSNGNSIFLPAAGVYDNNAVKNDTNGFYWSNILYSSNPQYARSFGFNSEVFSDDNSRYQSRYLDCPVRAVKMP